MWFTDVASLIKINHYLLCIKLPKEIMFLTPHQYQSSFRLFSSSALVVATAFLESAVGPRKEKSGLGEATGVYSIYHRSVPFSLLFSILLSLDFSYCPLVS